MHGANMKIVNAQQARICRIYKNTRLKLLEGAIVGILIVFNIPTIL